MEFSIILHLHQKITPFSKGNLYFLDITVPKNKSWNAVSEIFGYFVHTFFKYFGSLVHSFFLFSKHVYTKEFLAIFPLSYLETIHLRRRQIFQALEHLQPQWPPQPPQLNDLYNLISSKQILLLMINWILSGNQKTNTGPFLWNGLSKIQIFTDIYTVNNYSPLIGTL